MTDTMSTAPTTPGKIDARAAMEALNAEAGQYNIWLRTQANAPAQKAWFKPTSVEEAGRMAQGRVAGGQMKALPHRWRWKEISPYRVV